MRDKLRDATYFAEYIQEKTQGEQRIEQRISEGQIAVDRISPMRVMFFMYRMPTTLAAYSRGDSIDSLVPQLHTMIALAKDYWNPEMYEILLQMVSMGIMLDIEDAYFDNLKSLVEKAGYNDWLIDFLLHSRYSSVSFAGQKNYISKIYDQLHAIASSPTDKTQSMMKEYLYTWYTNRKDTSWFDSHKDTQKHLYYGYWSLEAGAFCKVLGIADNELKEVAYYPFDLAHFS